METLSQKRSVFKKLFLMFLIFLITGLIFYRFNVLTPMYGDDYQYAFSFYDGKRISSLGDIFHSLYYHYFSMNGRLTTHFFAHLFLMFDEGVFDHFNTLFFLCLGLVIYRSSGFGLKKYSPLWLCFVFVLLYQFTPAFGQSFLWTVASPTYLMGVAFLIAVLLPYLKHLRQPGVPSSRPWLTALAALVIGFLAGTINENNSIALLGMAAVATFISWLRKDLRPWMLTCLFGILVGYILMLIAPGNGLRMQELGSERTLSALLQQAKIITTNAVHLFHPLLILFLALLYLYLLQQGGKSMKEILLPLIPTGVLMVGVLGSSYSMIVTTYFPLRVWSGPVAFLIAACGSVASLIDFSRPAFSRVFLKTVSLFFILLTLVNCSKTVSDLKDIRYLYDTRVTSIQEQLARGEEDIYVPSIRSTNRFSCIPERGDLDYNSSSWHNEAMASYWGARSFNVIEN